MASKVILKDLFSALQLQMSAQLSTNREFILHPGSKGDSLEDTWIEWLRKYLPNRYCVDKAIVIDSTGQLSDQIDLVIYDQQYTPFVLTQNGIHYIPAEGVYAVFEVKPDLNGTVNVSSESISYIEYAGRKIESVRKLKRTSTYIIDRGEQRPPRPLTKIIGGILASTNTIKKNETLENHLKSLSGLKGIDMGCAVDFGAFIIEHDGQEDIKNTDILSRIKDYYNSRTISGIEFSKADVSLVSFFFQLTRYLQQSIGSVAAIDMSEYAKAIKIEIDEAL
ncbi:hypothetical protein CKK33_10530 [Mucilaginibacter sp. MD40]|uniref:DUF6602 domain-containing protein n=1 Tax=Mucilaginibacter sp. MD40 TaxID=2029590 RepID=UPI000BACC244|nr:DUF6602 domain-containing protein [Mucilaginibacter sp. MD40]PAW93904.1 hypothetical protein CKK33_10530 [Mucilaginibacter sp. MD40]